MASRAVNTQAIFKKAGGTKKAAPAKKKSFSFGSVKPQVSADDVLTRLAVPSYFNRPRGRGRGNRAVMSTGRWATMCVPRGSRVRGRFPADECVMHAWDE